jgi:hypothetical protein
MWLFSSKDPYAKIDRRKQLAEKRRITAKKKAWRRKNRIESWRKFKKQFKQFLDNPFAKRELTVAQLERQRIKRYRNDPHAKNDRRRERAEKRQRNAQRREWLHRQRADERQRLIKRLKVFLANPFAKKKLSSDEQELRYIKKLVKQDRKLERKKWWAKFRHAPLSALFPAKKEKLEGGGYLYVYNLTRKERKELARSKRLRRRENFKKIVASPELRRKFGFGFMHSTAYFILAFMFIYIVYQVVTILVASSYQIPVIWYYYRLKFPLYTYSPLYTRAALVFIFSSGPIMSLMLAFVFLKMFFTTHPFFKRFQLFYLWGFICGSNMFFGAYIAGFFTRTEFIYTSEWLFMSRMFDVEEIFFTVISFVVMLVIGRILTPLFLVSSGSVTLISPENRQVFIITQVVLPWLAGILILFLITLPTFYVPLIIKTITPGLALLPSLYLFDLLQYDNIHKSGDIRHNYFKWSIVIFVAALLFFYRIILSFGLAL